MMSKHQLCLGDCSVWIPQLQTPITCIFADWPDNIGLKYDGYDDNLPIPEYVALLDKWVRLFISKAATTWISFNARWVLKMGTIVDQLCDENPELEWKPCVQRFTFGQHRHTDLGNGHRPLWRLRWPHGNIYPNQIRVESERQKMGDKRAAPGGKVPLDVFDFPRVTGNSRQRRAWHKTQLHEGLVERCIKLSTKPGDWVVDAFGGTGTTLRVCRRIDRWCTLIEKSPTYCSKIAEEHGMKLRERGELKRWEL